MRWSSLPRSSLIPTRDVVTRLQNACLVNQSRSAQPGAIESTAFHKQPALERLTLLISTHLNLHLPYL